MLPSQCQKYFEIEIEISVRRQMQTKNVDSKYKFGKYNWRYKYFGQRNKFKWPHSEDDDDDNNKNWWIKRKFKIKTTTHNSSSGGSSYNSNDCSNNSNGSHNASGNQSNERNSDSFKFECAISIHFIWPMLRFRRGLWPNDKKFGRSQMDF